MSRFLVLSIHVFIAGLEIREHRSSQDFRQEMVEEKGNWWTKIRAMSFAASLEQPALSISTAPHNQRFKV
ncbi:hypothetical protein CSA56_16835 [candidate division KSB3 bacterium]|uniref:Uncharacterized protein n=1 Tax=candidate division KSB3 bacterium TaxID=2044937 RepID=A0A2G6K8I0_9BACT|nr:MAG: hypothetical protein CSA56_16835 [candidate division KSB3 bacterium]